MNKVTKQTETKYFIECEDCGYREEIKQIESDNWECCECELNKQKELKKEELLAIDNRLLKAKIIKVGRCCDFLDYIVLEMPDRAKITLSSINTDDDIGLQLNAAKNWELE